MQADGRGDPGWALTPPRPAHLGAQQGEDRVRWAMGIRQDLVPVEQVGRAHAQGEGGEAPWRKEEGTRGAKASREGSRTSIFDNFQGAHVCDLV